MMYSEKLALAIKHNGRVLREHGDTVKLPFGSEFSLYFKNLHSTRATVKVWIDGQLVTEGAHLVIKPNSTLELERFIKNGNLESGNKFKFIERTAKIEDGPRGINIDDGLIRVEFEFEKMAAKVEDVTIRRTFIDDKYWRRSDYPWTYPYNPHIQPMWVSRAAGTAGIESAQLSDVTASYTAATSESLGSTLNQVVQASAVNMTGITVPGNESSQKFITESWFPTDGQTHSMVLKLSGYVGDQEVTKPVTVKTKVKCPTCGTSNKSGTKFCSECGTNLQAVS